MTDVVFDAVVWSDYLCPWCYLGLDRSRLLESLGVRVTPLAYELHPEIPETGLPLAEHRGRRLYDRLAAECEAVGLPFSKPTVIPNTRRALETAEWVRANAVDRLAALHRALFAAVFERGEPIHDPDALDQVVRSVGVDADAARQAVDAGELREVVDLNKADALEHGVTGTPAWLIDGRLLIPGVQAPEHFERMVTRLRAKRAGP